MQDSEVAFLTTPPQSSMIPNETGHTDIFGKFIDSNVSYVIKNKRNNGNWDSTRAAGVDPASVYRSLTPQVKDLLAQIRNYDGTRLTNVQIFSMIGTRILDGSVGRITLKYLQNLAESSKKRVPVDIIPSTNSTINEVAAAALIDQNKFPLAASGVSGRMKNILPNWKTLATDTDKFLPLTIGGSVKRFFIKDDDTFELASSQIKVQDGDYVEITRGGTTQRLFVQSEIDHAFLLPESTRQKALSLLGAESGRTLEVSAAGSLSSVEFDYSLTSNRLNFYVLSCVLSSIDTKPSESGSFLLKDSTAEYTLLDTSTDAGIVSVNNFIKYKANHRVFLLDDEDLIFNYLEKTNKLTVRQTDILFDSPKTNKTIPLLTRQIPRYILIYPTNRADYNLFNDKSTIDSIAADGAVRRSLKCKTTIVPDFSKKQTNKFVRVVTDGKEAVDVLGNTNAQTRITKINTDDTVFKTGYKSRSKFIAAAEATVNRKKTGFRLVKEIITELDSNYLLNLNGVGKSLTEFDVFSRLYVRQFNLLSRLENFTAIRDSIRNGLISDVKVIPPIRHANKQVTLDNTLLVKRKEGASADTFKSIKSTRSGNVIVPPTTLKAATRQPAPNPAT